VNISLSPSTNQPIVLEMRETLTLGTLSTRPLFLDALPDFIVHPISR
jgi:hypothetical protein